MSLNNNNTNLNSSSDDEVKRKILKPNPSIEQIISIIQSSYIDPSKPSVVITSASSKHVSNNENNNSNKNINDSNTVTTIEIIQQLDSYDDCNYHIQINNVSFLLKIHNGVESDDYIQCYNKSNTNYYKNGYGYSVLHYQNALLYILNNNNIPSNNSIPPNNNNNKSDTTNTISPISIHTLPVVSTIHSPCQLAVRLLSWVDGCPMSSISYLPIEAIAEAGRFLGTMNHAFDTMMTNTTTTADKVQKRDSTGNYDENIEQIIVNHLNDNNILKAGQRYHQWDGKNFSNIRSFVQYIPIMKRRLLIESIVDEYDKLFVVNNDNNNTSNNNNNSKKFRIGINHGDFNDANILIDPSTFRITGVIDFGDSTESWRVLDIAVAMAYALLTTFGKANRSIAAAAAMLRGYNIVYPLQPIELEHLYLLIVCRLACSCTLGAYSMNQNPDNKYLLLHSAPAWNALELLWGYDTTYRSQMSVTINNVFKQACTGPDRTNTSSIDGRIYCSDIMFPDPSIVDFMSPLRRKEYNTQER